jgi:hypothetical protein
MNSLCRKQQNRFPQGDTDCQIPDKGASAFVLQTKKSRAHLVSEQVHRMLLCFFSQKGNQLGTKSALKVGDSSDDTDKRC